MELAWVQLHGRDGHTVGRELLQQLAGDLKQIAVTERGKPYFPDGSVHFSISHTNNHAFCAISHKNIGIDAEECERRIRPALAKKVLSASEYRRYEAARDPAAALLRVWGLKESYAKLTGRGLGDYLYETDFDPDDTRVQIIDGCFVAVMEENEYAI